MLTNRIAGISRLQVAIQMVAVTAIFWCLYGILEVYTGTTPDAAYVKYWIITLLSLGIEGMMRSSVSKDSLTAHDGSTRRITIRQVAAMAFGISLFLALTKDPDISRTFLLALLGSSLVILAASNVGLPRLLSDMAFRGKALDRTIIVGTAAKLLEYRERIQEMERYGIQVTSIISPDDPSKLPEDIRHLYVGGLDTFHEHVERAAVEQVILLELLDDVHAVREFVRLCECRSVRFLLLNNIFEQVGARVGKKRATGMDVMFLHDEPLEDPLNRILKRALDLVISAFVLLTVFPIACIIVKIIHMRQSPGPMFFVQERMGMMGKPFRIVKFRSLNHNIAHSESTQVSASDDRVFSGGRFLRKTSIDELPQFLNVLMGSMSAIGPRPHLVEHDEVFARFMENYHTRARVKPGITGLAQVRGHRGQTEGDPNKVKLRVLSDIAYLENWSLELDFSILFRTVLQVVKPPKSAF